MHPAKAHADLCLSHVRIWEKNILNKEQAQNGASSKMNELKESEQRILGEKKQALHEVNLPHKA
jgi:hypothetical protein